MICSQFEQFIRYFRQKILWWENHGTSKLGIVINTLFYALIWILVPLETNAWTTFRQKHRQYYPQIDFDCPKPMDSIRILIQTVAIVCFKIPFDLPRHVKSRFLWFYQRASGLFRRYGTFVERVGTALLTVEPQKTTDTKQRIPKLLQYLFFGLAGSFALGLAILCITQPFNIQGQVLFLSVMLFLALILARIKARLALMLLFVISIVVSGRYLWWRCYETINTNSFLEISLSLLLLSAEIYAFIVMVLGYFQVCWVLDRKPYPLPEKQKNWPHVDIFIPTYNEDLAIIKPTVLAAQNLQWPEEKLHIYILDDGSRPQFEKFAKDVGVGYIKRTEHRHAKAGNINHAMTLTHGEFITIFDCDHVPSCDFLTKTMGWLIKDERVALVQTPHHFYSPDPFEKNLHLDRSIPIENSLFHDFIQKGNDTWNATMFCGSSAVMRRKALEQIGGIAVETVTEDAHTSLKLNRLGWSSVFIDAPVASGLSTDTLAAHIGQRIRWARGMVQIFRLDNPFIGKGLSLAQRLCFFNAMFHFFHGLPRLIFLLAPLPYMFANIYIIYATAAAIFAYVLPHMIHSAITNQRLQRGYRYPFLSGIYETVLAWYILLPTTVALFMPHKGKFNVTAKGGTINEKYLDWNITKPFLLILILNLIGLGIGLYKAFFDPNAEYLTLAINIGWIVYNLMILFGSMAVAVEEVQKHEFPRIALTTPLMIINQSGLKIAAEMTHYSQVDICLKVAEQDKDKLLVSDSVWLQIQDGRKWYSFNAVISKIDATSIESKLVFNNISQERAFNRCTFARKGMWAIKPTVPCDDRFLSGFFHLARLAIYGMRSMLEFLPGHWQNLYRVIRWLGTFLPQAPTLRS